MNAQTMAIRNPQSTIRNRGAVLVMVLGLLAIILLLGVSFMAVAHMNARQADAVVQYSQVEPISGMVLTRLQGMMKETQPGNWQRYATYPSHDLTYWLTSNNYTTNPAPGTIPHICDLFHKSSTGVGYTNVATGGLVDTNGDNIPDAMLEDTGIINSRGDKYYVAVSVYDEGGKLCVSTAADKSSLTTPTSPVNVDLAGLVGGVRASINTLRGYVDTTSYYNGCASRLMNPGNYSPFAASDEIPLIYFSGTAGNNGRLWSAVNGLTVDVRRQLSAYNASTAVARFGGPNILNKIPLTLNGFSVQADRDRLFKALARISGPNSAKYCAHLVANLWAYLSDGVGANAPNQQAYKYSVPAGYGADGYVAYGLVEQPAIAEVYAYYIPASAAPPAADDSGWAYAIKILNPTNKAISLYTDDTHSYQLICGGETYILPNVSIPGGGSSIVLWAAGGSVPDHTGVIVPPARQPVGDPTNAHTQFGFPTGANAYQLPTALPKFGSGPISLVRVVGGDTVPIDSLSLGDINFAPAAPTAYGSGETFRDALRDYDTTRQRAFVGGGNAKDTNGIPIYWKYAAFSRWSGNNCFGAGFVYTDLPSINEGFPITLNHGPTANIGDLSQLYIIGPSNTPSGVNNVGIDFPHALVKDDGPSACVWAGPNSTDNGQSRGHLDFHAPSLSSGFTAVGAYPAIPAGTMLDEVLTVLAPDPVRSDGATPRATFYGRINVNTATSSVLQQLPWPGSVTLKPRTGANIVVTISAADIQTIANTIIAYRDRTGVYANRVTGSGITGLRSDINGYLSPSEVAVPLADYMASRLGAAPDTVCAAGYLAARDSLYKVVSNVISVNSDTFTANILVRLRSKTGLDLFTWNYVAMLDRSNVTLTRDEGQLTMDGTGTGVQAFAVSGQSTVWTASCLVGGTFVFTTGPCAGQYGTITANDTGTSITVTPTAPSWWNATANPLWSTTPTNGSRFWVVQPIGATSGPEAAVLMFGRVTQ